MISKTAGRRRARRNLPQNQNKLRAPVMKKKMLSALQIPAFSLRPDTHKRLLQEAEELAQAPALQTAALLADAVDDRAVGDNLGAQAVLEVGQKQRINSRPNDGLLQDVLRQVILISGIPRRKHLQQTKQNSAR